MLGPQATLGLGTTAGRSIQSLFDSAVATLRSTLDALGVATDLLMNVEQTVASHEDGKAAEDPASGLAQSIRYVDPCIPSGAVDC